MGNTFIVRIIKKEKWETGFIDMDMSWDVPFTEVSNVVDYLSQFNMRPKRKPPHPIEKE